MFIEASTFKNLKIPNEDQDKPPKSSKKVNLRKAKDHESKTLLITWVASYH